MSHHNEVPFKKLNRELNQNLSVLVVEDHVFLRESLIDLLATFESISITESAATAEEALGKLSSEVDLLIVDLSLPGRDGIWLTLRARDKYPNLRILVLTMHEEPDIICRALEAGVDGYLTKWAGRNELLKAIDSIFVYGSYLHARIAPTVIDALRHRQAQKRSELSRRELRIGKCLLQGQSNTKIAQELSLSVSTVKTDLRSLYSKLKVSCRHEAVAELYQRQLYPRTDQVANIL